MPEQKDVRSPLLMKTPKLQLTAEQASTKKKKKMLEPTRKDTLLPQTKKKPQYDGRRGAITITSNPIPARRETHKLEIIIEVVPWE